MSTRGIYGFRISGQDKATYSHSDSYPTWLGNSIMQFIHDTPEKELREIAARIELIKEDNEPTPEQINELKQYADLSVSTGSLKEWYCLMRRTQGDLTSYKNGLRLMIDSQMFLRDSLYCEWGYIINIDNETLEIYRGFNTRKTAVKWGRYACLSVDEKPNGRRKYYGVTLLKAINLSHIRGMSAESIKADCEFLEEFVSKQK